ncbi:MAG TPA: DUF2796 domain-containing protein [Steroidobacteraceae bacterium]|jgi:hypothetical protein
MNIRDCSSLLALGMCLAAASAQAFEQHVHEHGRAFLNVAIDGTRLTLELDTPAINVLGFEHAPHSDAERQAVDRALGWLQSGRELFLVPGAAGCRFVHTTLEPPRWGSAAHEDHAGEEEHADYHATYEFECAHMEQLAWIDVRLVDRLMPGVKTEATVVTPTLQTQRTLMPGALRLDLH